MKIELPVRWTEKKKLNDEEETLKRLLSDPDNPEGITGTEQYTYGSIVMDLKDIRCFNELDPEHCIVRTYFNDSFCIGVPFDDFKNLVMDLTGQIITVIRKAPLPPLDMQKKPKKKKDKDPENPDDSIIL